MEDRISIEYRYWAFPVTLKIFQILREAHVCTFIQYAIVYFTQFSSPLDLDIGDRIEWAS
jgi:hypothetical protein